MSRVVLLTIFVPAWTSRVMFAPPASAERPRACPRRASTRRDPSMARSTSRSGVESALSRSRHQFDLPARGAVLESTGARAIDDQRSTGIRCDNRRKSAPAWLPRDQIFRWRPRSLHLDTYLDRRRAYISAHCTGSRASDGILDGSEPPDWGRGDAVWDGASRRDSTGWTTEIAISLRAMRFDRNGGARGGLIRREITKERRGLQLAASLWRWRIRATTCCRRETSLGLEDCAWRTSRAESRFPSFIPEPADVLFPNEPPLVAESELQPQ